MIKNEKIAGKVGSTLAHVQHLLDRFYAWGFKRLEEVGKEPKVIDTTPESGIVGNAKRLGRKAAGFVGKAGDAYFSTYEKLKRDER